MKLFLLIKYQPIFFILFRILSLHVCLPHYSRAVRSRLKTTGLVKSEALIPGRLVCDLLQDTPDDQNGYRGSFYFFWSRWFPPRADKKRVGNPVWEITRSIKPHLLKRGIGEEGGQSPSGASLVETLALKPDGILWEWWLIPFLNLKLRENTHLDPIHFIFQDDYLENHAYALINRFKEHMRASAKSTRPNSVPPDTAARYKTRSFLTTPKKHPNRPQTATWKRFNHLYIINWYTQIIQLTNYTQNTEESICYKLSPKPDFF